MILSSIIVSRSTFNNYVKSWMFSDFSSINQKFLNSLTRKTIKFIFIESYYISRVLEITKLAGLRDLTILLNVNSSLLTSHINASISATVWTLDFILDLTDVTLTHRLQHLKPPNLHTTREAFKKNNILWSTVF